MTLTPRNVKVYIDFFEPVSGQPWRQEGQLAKPLHTMIEEGFITLFTPGDKVAYIPWGRVLRIEEI